MSYNTLIIQGTGSLDVSSSSYTDAGIDLSLGCNLVINGGEITATGKGNGIGGDQGATTYKADITISGGDITATGGLDAAGIGSGPSGSCGNIDIRDGLTRFSATKGGNSNLTNCIGFGLYGSCSSVTIEGTLCWDGHDYTSIEIQEFLTQKTVSWEAPVYGP